LAETEVPRHLLYTREHHWIRIEADTATFGLTEHAQNELGDIVYVELPEPGREFHASDEVGSIESVKTTTELYSPVSGEIVEVNEDIEKSPDLINRDPYGAGWIARIRLSDPSEADDLLTADDYGQFVEEIGEE
jgi:glycine cleavage system H protein